MLPHFQIGMFEDQLFCYVLESCMKQKDKATRAKVLKENLKLFNNYLMIIVFA